MRLLELALLSAGLLTADLAFGQGIPRPQPAACPAAIGAIADCYSARHDSGAYLLAAVPKNWNGNLIVFAHGGPAIVPPTPKYSEPNLVKYSFAVRQGFAWVASSYRREGYGVRVAVEDTEHARRFFVEGLGKPRRTILHGASYGGLVGAKLLEAQERGADGSLNFDGGLLNSGLVAGAPLGYEFRADLRAVYQYYCGNLPRADEPQYPLWTGLPAEAKITLKDLEVIVDACTGVAKAADARTEVQKQNLANIIGVMRFPETLLARHMQSATFIFRDIAERVTHGRSAFSNVGVRYMGSSDDAELNRGVARFTADPEALEALRADGAPAGHLQVPVVSIHSVNDPQVAVEVQSACRDAVSAGGSGGRLVQAFTDERAHTGQSAPELAAALDAVMQWIDKGTKPSPQSIAAACEALRTSLEGQCRYRPGFEPKPYGTRYARGAAVN
jgi:hypothetical protein